MPSILLERETVEHSVNLQEMFAWHVGMILIYHVQRIMKCLMPANCPLIKETVQDL